VPKKYFKKYLPSADSVKQNRLIRIFGPLLRHPNLWHLNRRSVAGGVAIGLVTGLIPGPVQFLSSAILSVVFRVNLPVAMLTTLYTNPFTFIPLYILAYNIGSWLTGETVTQVPIPTFEWSWSNLPALIPALVHWMSAMGHTLLIGLLVQCTAFSLIGYFTVRGLWRLWVIRQWRDRQQRRAGVP
jgi:uncharacterized protein